MTIPTPQQKTIERQVVRLALLAAPFTLVGVGLLLLWRLQNIGWALPVAIIVFLAEAWFVFSTVSRIAKAQQPNDRDKV